MELNLGQWVVIVISALLILAYIRGFYYNRQRAGRILDWLADGLKTFGPVSLGEKLPGIATGGRLEVKQATAPVKRVEAVYLLAPRENPLFLLFHLIQGRRDEMILWITYQSKPALEVEVARPYDRQLESRLNDADKIPLSVSTGPHNMLLASQDNKDGVLPGKVQSFLERHGKQVYRLVLRGNKPHLFLRANLGIMDSVPASEFFSEVCELAK